MDDMTKNAIRELAAYVLQHGTVTERARKLSVFLLSQTGMTEEEIVDGIENGFTFGRSTVAPQAEDTYVFAWMVAELEMLCVSRNFEQATVDLRISKKELSRLLDLAEDAVVRRGRERPIPVSRDDDSEEAE